MKKGFSQIELLLVIGILAILLSLGAILFGSFARQDQILEEAKKIESVINEAKMKTIAGFSLGGDQGLNFGVYFQTDRYIFFPGLVFDSLDTNNQEFLLPSSLEIEGIFLPSESIVFKKITGEVVGFDSNQNYLILSDKNSQEKKKISVNQLGTVRIESQ